MNKELEAARKLVEAVKAKEGPLRDFVQEYGEILEAAKETEKAREEDQKSSVDAVKDGDPITAESIKKLAFSDGYGTYFYPTYTYTYPTYTYGYSTTGNTNFFGGTTSYYYPTYTISTTSNY